MSCGLDTKRIHVEAYSAFQHSYPSLDTIQFPEYCRFSINYRIKDLGTKRAFLNFRTNKALIK